MSHPPSLRFATGAATRRSRALADQLAESIVDRKVFTSPAQELALLGPALAGITTEDCLEALRGAWASVGRDIFVSGNLTLDNPDKAIRAAYAESQAVPVQPPARVVIESLPYTGFGPPGRIVSERAKKPELTEIKESLRTNRYWLESVLALAQEEPQRLDWARTHYADTAKITKADLDALAAEYLDPMRAARFAIVPEGCLPGAATLYKHGSQMGNLDL